MLKDFQRDLETLDGIETDYVKILYYDLPKNYVGEYRSYHYPRFCTILHGHKHVTLNNNKQFTYDKDQYLLLPSNSKVRMNIEERTRALVFELNRELIDKVMNKTDVASENNNDEGVCLNYYLGQNKYDISDDIHFIFNAFKSDERNNVFLIDLYAQKLVFDLIKNKTILNILNTDSCHPIHLAVKYINENIHSIINIKELANELYMSESNFSHLFKKFMGMSPIDYIKDKKLELSLEYLRMESVTDVALTLGYSNISYFIKLFKNKYYMTPKQYQLKCLTQ